MEDYRPYLVSWNITKRCNLSCPHCYLSADSEASAELTGKEAKFVIDELSYLNNRLMLILSGGEPMLRKDLVDIIGYSSKAGFITVLGSNGTLLTYKNLKTLKKAGLKGVGISIDSATSKYHDAFRGLDGAWELSVSALRNAKELGLETQVDVTLTDENVHEIKDVIEAGVALSVKAVNFFFLVCTGRAMKTNISGYNYEAALKKIVELSRSEKRVMVRARCAPHIYRLLYEEDFNIPEGTRGCLAGRHYMRITPEGNITPCPYMPAVVGNIKERSLVSIWENGSSLQQLRQEMYNGRCGICEYTEICGGCRARALSDTGDFMGEDSLCTYSPSGKEKVGLNIELQSELEWDESAKNRVRNIPVFMKGMIVKMIEAKAKERGIKIITSELIGELKGSLGVHGNKKSV